VNLSVHPAPITQTAGEYAEFPVSEQVRVSTGISQRVLLRSTAPPAWQLAGCW